ncbi:hypothetical protein NMG60_11003906 [Bertholletia excelsa]
MPLYRATSVLCSCKYECSGIVNPQRKPLVVGVNDRHIGNNDKKENNKIIIVNGGRTTRRCFKTTTARAASSSGSLATVRGLTATAAAIMLSLMGTNGMELLNQQPPPETLSDIPQMLSSECSSSAPGQEDCKKKARIQRPKSKQAESCTVKCVTTCIRGGLGSPGEGPLNFTRPLVIFKEGFRSRQYCLVECSDICNLISDGDGGP